MSCLSWLWSHCLLPVMQEASGPSFEWDFLRHFPRSRRRFRDLQIRSKLKTWTLALWLQLVFLILCCSIVAAIRSSPYIPLPRRLFAASRSSYSWHRPTIACDQNRPSAASDWRENMREFDRLVEDLQIVERDLARSASPVLA